MYFQPNNLSNTFSSHNCDDEYCNDMDGEDTMDTGREDVPNGHLMSTDVKICDDKAKGQDYYKR